MRNREMTVKNKKHMLPTSGKAYAFFIINYHEKKESGRKGVSGQSMRKNLGKRLIVVGSVSFTHVHLIKKMCTKFARKIKNI